MTNSNKKKKKKQDSLFFSISSLIFTMLPFSSYCEVSIPSHAPMNCNLLTLPTTRNLTSIKKSYITRKNALKSYQCPLCEHQRIKIYLLFEMYIHWPITSQGCKMPPDFSMQGFYWLFFKKATTHRLQN